MSLIAKANADGSITLSCGAEALNIAVIEGQLVVSAAVPTSPILRQVAASPPPPPPPPPKPVIIPGPPATGPRTMIRVPGFGEIQHDPFPLDAIRIGEALCFEVKHDEWVDTKYVWERVCTVGKPRSLHFFFPTDALSR